MGVPVWPRRLDRVPTPICAESHQQVAAQAQPVPDESPQRAAARLPPVRSSNARSARIAAAIRKMPSKSQPNRLKRVISHHKHIQPGRSGRGAFIGSAAGCQLLVFSTPSGAFRPSALLDADQAQAQASFLGLDMQNREPKRAAPRKPVSRHPGPGPGSSRRHGSAPRPLPPAGQTRQIGRYR